MGFLKNLRVKKVSFVRRGANRRKFLLLKSAEDVINNDGDQQKHKEELMQKLVKERVMEILKSEQDPTKVIELLKADKDIENLQLSEEDFAEVQTSVEFFKALLPEKKEPPVKKEEPKSKEEPVKKEGSENGSIKLEDVLAKLATVTESLAKSHTVQEGLAEKLEKQEHDNNRREILKWLHLECPYLPVEFNKTADEILKLQDVSKSAAQVMKDGLQAASAALSNSDVFDEVGTGGPGRPNGHIPGSELLKEIKEAQAEVKKSGEKVDQIELIRSIVTSKGRNSYLSYREEVLRRAQMAHLGPEIANYL